ncbi:uncharacterized protein LOC112346473 [Selaginella moellendorffii]|uniref:uncharacterized protein LOC112346473 n=1 Tax=Selaginella moellendorffii TaxID=88036 RepID=UPI000D1CAA4A|nr:uncharacterized protein LOC112346473 [Selaginella moellendorffii]|eukprot:XP_024531280.1 uncharacterized protein LOC112346473 [Selaginella moellendorffii]
MDTLNKLCCVVPPASAGEIVAPSPINEDEVKKSLIARGSSVVSVDSSDGFGIIISKDVILTTSSTFPDPAAAEGATVNVRTPPAASLELKLWPQRFFVTNRDLDLTLVACDPITTSDVSPLMSDASKISRQSLEAGSKVYILGYPRGSKMGSKSSAALGEGRVTVKEDKFLRIQTDGLVWASGSAGFNEQGQLAFVICNPHQSFAAGSSSIHGEERRDDKQSGVSIGDVCSRLIQV